MMTDKDPERIATLVAEWLDGRDDGEMFDACTENPEAAWQVILTLVDRELTEDQVADLAAGPMEDLLVWHGSRFIDRVEEKATTDTRFNFLLGGVWRREMPQQIWDRVVKVRKQVW